MPPRFLQDPLDMMRTAVSLIEQCKGLARRKKQISVEAIASFCVVSPEVAGELLHKLLSMGIVRRAPGRGKIYQSVKL